MIINNNSGQLKDLPLGFLDVLIVESARYVNILDRDTKNKTIVSTKEWNEFRNATA